MRLWLLGLTALALIGGPFAVADDVKYVAGDYNYLLGKVPGLNDDLLKMHFKLYQGYVTNTNVVLKQLEQLTAVGEARSPQYGALKRILGWEFNGMLLHEYYFENLGASKLMTSDPLYQRMVADFGSFDKWRADFVATGAMRGIGWVVTYVDPQTGSLMNEWINEHDVGHLSGARPVLIMDVFEHAYITEFGLDRAKYIDVFFDNINWSVVSKRYHATQMSQG